MNDFEFDGKVLLIAFVFWLIVIAGIWKFNIGTEAPMYMKVMMSVLSLPVIYLTINFQISRG